MTPVMPDCHRNRVLTHVTLSKSNHRSIEESLKKGRFDRSMKAHREKFHGGLRDFPHPPVSSHLKGKNTLAGYTTHLRYALAQYRCAISSLPSKSLGCAFPAKTNCKGPARRAISSRRRSSEKTRSARRSPHIPGIGIVGIINSWVTRPAHALADVPCRTSAPSSASTHRPST